MKSSLRFVVAAAALATLVIGISVAPASAESRTSSEARSAAALSFDKKAKSLTDPKSAWVIVNKRNPLKPKAYVPSDLVTVPVAHANPVRLRKGAADAVVKMFRAFERETGSKMQSQSAYRSYTTQKSVYADWVKRLGQKGADKTSARPGFSEHQTGLAIDISAKPANCTLKACFAKTKQGKWLAKNAWEYGFVLRYPKWHTKTTGYEFEPWHYRYVGKSLSTEMHRVDAKTLESFFGLAKAPDYK